ncbi:MAG: glycosyltransferase family 2 protein [Micropruina sp.]|uniref:glycosyltransferase family 2 protein n=1 Tax=Micropruina sp. TaxID=2737536 RepID=UPI0039E5ADF4
MSATIGVVVPVYRVERYVAGCIASIGAQTLAPDRVILVDDRGGDASMQRALDAARQAGLDVEVLTQPENRGLSAARNAGLARLDTDLVWFCDSDDTVEPEFLEAMRDALLASDAQLAMCRTARVDEAGRRLSIDEDPFDRSTMPGTELARRLLLSEARGYACNKLFRRELLGPEPFPEGHVYEDVAPLLRIALSTARVALVDAPLYRYLINESSISRRFGPHTHDLFVQDDHVRALLADAGVFDGADTDAWRWAHLRFRYDGVVFPAANMALRAKLAGDGGSAAAGVVARARALIGWPDLPRLWWHGARRQAVAAAVLALNPWLYAQILRRR